MLHESSCLLLLGDLPCTLLSALPGRRVPPSTRPPLVPLLLPSLPSLAPHCHCHPTWGGGRSSWSGVGQGPSSPPWGPWLGPLPSLSYSVPHRPFRCCEEGRQAAESCWALARSGDLGDHCPGEGQSPGIRPPAKSLTWPLPRRGLASSPRCWATTAEKTPCLRPQSLLFLPCVCAHMSERVKLWVRLSAWEPCVCLIGARSRGYSGPGGVSSSVGGVRVWVCAMEAHPHFQRKSEAP